MTYALLCIPFFFCSLLYAKVFQKDMSVWRHLSIGVLLSAVLFFALYIPLHIMGKRTTESDYIPLVVLSRSGNRAVYVLAVSVPGEGDSKKDTYIVNLNRVGLPSQGMFEGDARLEFEDRNDGVLEKRTTRLIGNVLLFTQDSPWHEYIIHVPKDSLERPPRVKEFW